jgi:hypothetical protein
MKTASHAMPPPPIAVAATAANQLWVVEISQNSIVWSPTLWIGLTSKDGANKLKQAKHQSEVLKLGPQPKFRVKVYRATL